MQLSVVVSDLVLIGGGHSHVFTIKDFGLTPVPGLRVTLISKDVETPYSGMLPGYVAGYYTREQCHVDLLRLCSNANVRFVKAEVCRLDPVNKRIYCTDGRPAISYDVTSIDIGITPKLPDFSNPLASQADVAGLITPVKPIDGFCRRWDVILARVLAMTGDDNLTGDDDVRIVVVGGGAGGVELSFAIHHRLTTELRRMGRGGAAARVKVSVVNRGSTLLKSHNRGVQRIVGRLLAEKGIQVVLDTDIVDVVVEAGKSYLVSDTRARIPFDEAIWCTQASAQSWLREAGLDVTPEGFVRVNTCLESINTADVFACGDVSHLDAAPRPKAGVFAVRAGPPLTANIRLRLAGKPLVPWTPQTHFLGIIGTGDAYAVASRGPLAIEGSFLWTLKEHIDEAWMDGYRGALSAGGMQSAGAAGGGDGEALVVAEGAAELLSGATMRCGGCGSKISSAVLSAVLSELRAEGRLHERSDVVRGIGGDAALVRPAAGLLQVQTVDYFRSFIKDSYVFGKVAAMHALSDVYAMNGEGVTALATCVVPFGLPGKVAEELHHMLAGVASVLSAERVALVGGHSSEGAETALGITANGVVSEKDAFSTDASVEEGDVLVLTKALGTGSILAADMRGEAKGVWVWGAVESMLQSNRRAAQILRAEGCSLCTDVTGFGLVGHLAQLLRDKLLSSGLQVELRVQAVPPLAGALELVTAGRVSSLHAENLRSSSYIENPSEFSADSRYALLFDPQTSGGLCGVVPRLSAQRVIDQLRLAGYASACSIGTVVAVEGKDASLFKLAK